MKIKRVHIVTISILTALALLLVSGFKSPPDNLKSADISLINSISINKGAVIELTDVEIKYWKNLEFEITQDSPGNTPDVIIELLNKKGEFNAMYNKNDNVVYFSFVSEVKYGFLNLPPAGGWTKPLYKGKATDELLSLLKIKNVLLS